MQWRKGLEKRLLNSRALGTFAALFLTSWILDTTLYGNYEEEKKV
jgi:hypothetical protein